MEELKQKQIESECYKKSILTELKETFGVNNLEEAEKHLVKFQAQCQKQEARFDKQLAAFGDKYDGYIAGL